jgi:polysaccharide pyruvyl transferase WcaK-like protein
MKCLALGFFDRGNFGDELYKSVYADCLAAKDIEFTCMSLEDMKPAPKVPSCFDAVCVGGGDILNAYFMRHLAPKLASFKGTKIALSVGVPFESCTPYVDLFDYVILRAHVDEETIKARIGAEHVACFPDMAYTLRVPRTIGLPWIISPRRIGVFLSRPIFAGGKNRHYSRVVRDIANNLDSVCRSYPGAILYLIPCNTFESHDENDTILNAEVQALCQTSGRIKVVQEEQWSLRAYQRWFGAIDAAVCMRYHSAVMSMMFEVPFVALVCTRKMRTFLEDNEMRDHGCPMEVDPQTHAPIGLKAEAVAKGLQHVLSQGGTVAKSFPQTQQQFVSLVRRLLRGRHRRTSGAVPLSDGARMAMVSRVVEALTWRVGLTPTAAASLLAGNKTGTTAAELKGMDPVWLAMLMCHHVTGNADAPYVYGLSRSLSQDECDVKGAVDWIMRDHYLTGSVRPLPRGERGARVTFSSMHRQSYKGLHRSGWHFAMKGLLRYHDDTGRSVLCDTYMDRTFHWASSVLIAEGVIPYRRPWIGILHHTTDTAFSDHNCTDMFESPALLASLPFCTAIVTLSRALEGEIRTLLRTHGFGGVRTVALIHPTESVPADSEFTMEKFERNPHRHVIQIGAWLRDPFAIYKLHLRERADHSAGVMKAVLHGRHMDNCVRPADNLTRLGVMTGHLDDATTGLMCRDGAGLMCRDQTGLMCRDGAGLMCRDQTGMMCRDGMGMMCREQTCLMCRDGMGQMCRDQTGMMCREHAYMCRSDDSALAGRSRERLGNKYVQAMLRSLHDTERTVKVLPLCDDQAYDQLLSENLVFLCLLDASAVNTVLECMVRNTPVVVNRLPALEELLGADYPLFYDDLHEAATILEDVEMIRRGHDHIKGLDKECFTLDAFCKGFEGVLSLQTICDE